MLVSRALQGQISRFLEAAKRIGSGDFASRVPIEGSDEFAELGEAEAGGVAVLAVALGAIEETVRAHGVITVSRSDRPFTDDDRELLRSLAAQATLALRNVQLHFQVRRQAIADELTGLANHGRFQDLLSAEIELVCRHHHPDGLIMLDIDDFRSVNDTYGHQQGDVVLTHVASALRETLT